jgi:hypothetical protein
LTGVFTQSGSKPEVTVLEWQVRSTPEADMPVNGSFAPGAAGRERILGRVGRADRLKVERFNTRFIEPGSRSRLRSRPHGAAAPPSVVPDSTN